MKNEIILFQPEEPQKNPTFLPYSLLPIAGALENAGYKVRIVDIRFEDYTKVDLGNALFCGITSFTGHQLKYALDVAKWIKASEPDMTVVWGGIHSSLLPKQTCEHPLVDIVVIGEGEETAVELAHALANGEPYDNIGGIVYKKNGQTIENETRPWIDMDESPLPPFHLLKRDRYNLDIVSLNTSRGCPFQCTFCFNRNWNKASYRYQSAEKVVDQMEWAKKMFPDIEFIGFNDDNFFVKFDRVKDVCREIKRRGLNLNWSAMCRADYINKFDDEMFQLLKDTGFKRFGIGGESGSIRMVRRMKKGMKPETLIEAVKRCREHDIQPVVSFMMGYPDETVEEINQTLELVDTMKAANPDAITNGIFIFTPYPGTEAFDIAVEAGYEVPGSLENWTSQCAAEVLDYPWINNNLKDYINTVQGISLFYDTVYAPFSLYPKRLFRRIVKMMLKTSAKIRWKYKLFKYSPEWKFYARYMEGKR
jgi:radical SAM superfamily enzyme YgiQ (UPF0313 family)